MFPQRVAYVVNTFPKVSETFIVGELAELRRRGIDVRICSLRPPQDTVRHDLVDRAGLLPCTCYDHDRFHAWMREFDPDVVHAHFATEPTSMARELAAKLDVPLTFTAHGYDIYRRPPHDFAERARVAAGVVTVSRANAAYLAGSLGVPAAKIRVIACGVDVQRFRPREPQTANSTRYIVCVARLVPVKHLELLVRACDMLRRRGLEFRCVIVGEGRSRPMLEQEIRQHGLDARVTLIGALTQDDVRRWWQQATVGVLTSHSEGMPVCLMEAAACGVPVVATAVGGVPELVLDGETGIVVAPGNVEQLASALQRLLGNRELVKRMGRAARDRAVEEFSVSRQVDRLLELWSEVEHCLRASSGTVLASRS
jgi:glycosyltransferase involved in cell wall biosynthesis